jgi:DMSO/TMAO reductase YedYZ heme-binding membrane subunit
VLLIGMVLTSFDRSAAWLGARRWNLMHRVGLHYVWGIFAFTYGGAATVGERLFPVVAIVVLLGALGLRVAMRVRPRSAALPTR